MSALVAITNQPSDNFYAETLVKDLGVRFGGAGTTTAGLGVVRKQLRAIGINPTLSDGSGLSRADRATPRQLVALLRSMAAGRNAGVFEASLATPGRTGTLAGRMRGTLRPAAAGRRPGRCGTSARSPATAATGGHLLAFSIMENNVSPLSVKRIEDKMVPALAAYEPPV